MSGTRFTLMSFKAGDGWPNIQVAHAADAEDVVTAATALAAKDGAERVEIWRDGDRLHTVDGPAVQRLGGSPPR